MGDLKRVKRELSSLKEAKHPNIVQLYDILETPKGFFIRTEYVAGGELADHIINMEKLSEMEACNFFRQIVAGLEYLHKLRIVHRDLKPENLLLNFDKVIKIVDFGLSNRYDPNELLQTACGSPCYAAPEMIAGKRYYGPAVDVWSSGIVLFAMICGFLPFEESNTSKLYKKILKGKFDIPNFVSREAKDLLEKILHIDPDKRITIKDIKKHKWFNLNCSLKMTAENYEFKPIATVHTKILSQMSGYNFKNVKLIEYLISNNKHNAITIAYNLLYNRVINRRNDLRREFNIGSKEKDESIEINNSLDSSIGSIEKSFSFSKSEFYKEKTELFSHKKEKPLLLDTQIGKRIIELKEKVLMKSLATSDKQEDNLKKHKRETSEECKIIVLEKNMKSIENSSKKYNGKNPTNNIIQVYEKNLLHDCKN